MLSQERGCRKRRNRERENRGDKTLISGGKRKKKKSLAFHRLGAGKVPF